MHKSELTLSLTKHNFKTLQQNLMHLQVTMITKDPWYTGEHLEFWN